MTESAEQSPTGARDPIRWTFDALPAAAAAIFLVLAWKPLYSRLINVVTYEMVEVAAPTRAGSSLIPFAVAIALLVLGVARRIAAPPLYAWTVHRAWGVFAPVCCLVGLFGWGLLATSPGILFACSVAVCAGWAAMSYSTGVVAPRWWGWVDRFAPWVLGVTILSATLWHTAEQFNFWQHFSLGYADFGFFVTELEYCLPWKDVPARFADTRMGYHCIPMFYLLAPLYALFRSSALLMVVGPLALNLSAIPFYQLARHRGAARSVALLVGLAWLALPSLSRLPYANTYGFQSIYLAVPWLSWAWSLALRGRWRASHVCLAAAMLCEETVCGVALGWGLYVALFTHRRRDGLVIAALALGYLVLCTTLIIPHFAASSSYSRMQLFGDVDAMTLLQRLFRQRAGLYLIALAAPLVVGLCRSRAALKLLIVAAPTLLLIVLMRNDDYLNIKYWHQSSVLPALFLAAVAGVCNSRPGTKERRDCGLRIADYGIKDVAPGALGLFVTALLFHHLLGFSPLAQAHRPYVADAAMQSPDPRTEVTAWVRARYPRETTTVLATERMAAHFCDYRAVYPASIGARETPAADVVIVDRGDTWDPIIRANGSDRLVQESKDHGFEPILELGSVVILRHPTP